jgi:hypothetical protein
MTIIALVWRINIIVSERNELINMFILSELQKRSNYLKTIKHIQDFYIKQRK